MKRLLIFSFVLLNNIFATMFGVSQLEPGTLLKSPKKVIQEIENYWNEIEQQDMWLLKVNDRKKYDMYMQQTRDHLEDALVASLMLSEIMKNTKKIDDNNTNHLQNFYRFSDNWLFSDDTRSKENRTDERIVNLNELEISDDMHRWSNIATIEQCQDQLYKYIMNLRTNYTYDKSRQILENNNKE